MSNYPPGVTDDDSYFTDETPPEEPEYELELPRLSEDSLHGDFLFLLGTDTSPDELASLAQDPQLVRLAESWFIRGVGNGVRHARKVLARHSGT